MTCDALTHQRVLSHFQGRVVRAHAMPQSGRAPRSAHMQMCSLRGRVGRARLRRPSCSACTSAARATRSGMPGTLSPSPYPRQVCLPVLLRLSESYNTGPIPALLVLKRDAAMSVRRGSSLGLDTLAYPAWGFRINRSQVHLSTDRVRLKAAVPHSCLAPCPQSKLCAGRWRSGCRCRARSGRPL